VDEIRALWGLQSIRGYTKLINTTKSIYRLESLQNASVDELLS
jgi:hypothetical protein